MSVDLKEIKSGVGLGDIKFGMKRDTVKDLLGKATEIEKFAHPEKGSTVAESWHYDKLEISLSFDKEDDWNLVTIAVSGKEFQYEGHSFIGMKKDEVIKVLEKLKVDDLDFEDWASEDTPTQELIASDNLGINLWLEEKTVNEVQWGPLYDDDGIDWPE